MTDSEQGMAGVSGEAVIDLDAIAANTAALVDRAAGAEVMAVVKADAYGHGLVPSARAALSGGARWLGVAQLDEALALRAVGVDAPLLAWLFPPGADLAAALEHHVTIGVSSRWALDEVAAAAMQTGQVADVHLKVDTGLSRNGVAIDDWPALASAAAAYSCDACWGSAAMQASCA